MAAEAILEAKGLRKAFGGAVAVADMDVAVAPGEIVGLIGPNGAGKTTLFNLVAGALEPDGGRVTLAGEDVTGLPAHALAKRGLARTFQLSRALNRMSVLDNVALAAPDQPGERLAVAITPFWRKREEAVEDRAREVLDFVGLSAKLDDYAGSLSGGQKKLLEIARALMLEPKVLLLDEPMAGVNPTLAKGIMERIRAIRDERGAAILIVEHDIESIMANSDRVIVMAEGTTLAAGDPETVRNDPRVIEAYLGGREP
ncbi:MAG TPA: ABC transporter ATP-binding protein [Candidatus Thermoplasmatota archaeon]|nr:ABC transporter ATP-binding protein [Candidatus Thermoplasmatota archaeon]